MRISKDGKLVGLALILDQKQFFQCSITADAAVF